MGYDCKKFKRGQVWMVHEDKELSELRVQLKDRTKIYTRPYLILTSDGLLEDDRPLIQGIPITSKIGHQTEEDIVFRNIELEQNKLEMSNIVTLDSDNFLRYMYTVSDQLMELVDERVLIRLGITYTSDEKDREIDALKEEIESLKKELESSNTIDSNSDSGVEEEAEPPKKKVSGGKKPTWTRVKAKNFLEQYKIKENRKEMQKKYKMTANRLAQTKYYLEKKFPELV